MQAFNPCFGIAMTASRTYKKTAAASRRPALTLVADNAKALSIDEARWRAVASKDARADGTFLFAVKTTRIYCRPSCPSRLPRRENVRFFESAEAARGAGFRACLRCKPDGPSVDVRNTALVQEACSLLDISEDRVNLADLAVQIGVSAWHFHRMFKAVTGITPRQYQAERRAGRVRSGLGRSRSVTDAVFDAGFASASRFYESADKLLGMKPADYRKGGAGETIQFAFGRSDLGMIIVATTSRGVCAVEFGDTEAALHKCLAARFPQAMLERAGPAFNGVVESVIAIIRSNQPNAALPLDVRGTAFQHQVWKALQCIAPGSTASYSDLAKKIGMPTASRAVAQACAQNKIAVLIPCHRVVRADGELSGYRWGAERKAKLLQREK